MCGRFAQFSPADILKAQFEIDTLTCGVTPCYNIAPTHEVLVVVRHGDERRLGLLRWGLLPPWMDEIKGQTGFINARIETLHEKPAFRQALVRRRCVILADGYFEWEGKGKVKKPYFCFLPSREPFAFAGLWESRTDKSGNKQGSCTIITRESQGRVSAIHHRMPVILDRDGIEAWLDPGKRDGVELQEKLVHRSIENVAYYRVSEDVNSVAFSGASCVEEMD
jgi:putative SOS response-associated peptidase YedK